MPLPQAPAINFFYFADKSNRIQNAYFRNKKFPFHFWIHCRQYSVKPDHDSSRLRPKYRPPIDHKERDYMAENTAPEMKPTLGLTGLTMNAMALIAPGAFLWLTFVAQGTAGNTAP